MQRWGCPQNAFYCIIIIDISAGNQLYHWILIFCFQVETNKGNFEKQMSLCFSNQKLCKCFKYTEFRETDKCNARSHFIRHQSPSRNTKSEKTNSQSVSHVTLLQRQILFAGTLFVPPNDHILKNITFDLVAGLCSGGAGNKRGLISVLWCSILNRLSAALVYGGPEALNLSNSDQPWHTQGLLRPS